MPSVAQNMPGSVPSVPSVAQNIHTPVAWNEPISPTNCQ
jgi:hypothetical protein